MNLAKLNYIEFEILKNLDSKEEGKYDKLKELKEQKEQKKPEEEKKQIQKMFPFLIKLNFNKLNVLNDLLVDELNQAIKWADLNEEIGCIIVTGKDKAFIAGADIKAMSELDFPSVYKDHFISKNWEEISKIRKPIIAAVNGFAIGGGCEFALMCDLIFASQEASFSQPELKLGLIPGCGATQRLPKEISKAKAMDLILTGRNISAQEAESWGLISRVFSKEELLNETIKIANNICKLSLNSLLLAKECVKRSLETSLSEGILFERLAFLSLFASQDKKEGIDAFLNKRPANFTNN